MNARNILVANEGSAFELVEVGEEGTVKKSIVLAPNRA